MIIYLNEFPSVWSSSCKTKVAHVSSSGSPVAIYNAVQKERKKVLKIKKYNTRTSTSHTTSNRRFTSFDSPPSATSAILIENPLDQRFKRMTSSVNQWRRVVVYAQKGSERRKID